MKEYISKSIQAKTDIFQNEAFLNDIEKAVDIIVTALKTDKKILLIGNGGSASDCNHLATELVSKFYKERKALNAISLAANNSTITAIANDYGYEKVFSRQIEAVAEKGDVLLAFSTSGNSANIIEALKVAENIGLVKIGFTGKNKSKMGNLYDVYDVCDVLLKVPSDETPIIQESHIMLGHLICKMVEEKIFL